MVLRCYYKIGNEQEEKSLIGNLIEKKMNSRFKIKLLSGNQSTASVCNGKIMKMKYTFSIDYIYVTVN